MHIIPPYLKKGDSIAITCSAGYLDASKTTACVRILEDWGFNVILGKTVGSASKNYFSGTDEERRSELQLMLDDNSIQAILFGRGGYGSSKIIDQLDFKKFKKHPKWLLGYSDITTFHSHVFSRFSIATIHSPMAAAFQKWQADQDYLISIQKCLTGKKMKYTAPAHPKNKSGIASGTLIGGNLALLAHVIGTKSDFNTDDRILLIEDIGEHLYQLDRMLVQLKRSGKLSKIKGLIAGGFTDVKDTERPFGKEIEEIILEHVNNSEIPICFDFPVGHQSNNYAIKLGIPYQLNVNNKGVSLTEIRE